MGIITPTTPPNLVAETDVEGSLGRDMTDAELARFNTIATRLSSEFRKATATSGPGQLITAGNSVAEFNVIDGRYVRLYQRPVTAVNSVTDHHGNTVGFDLHDQTLTLHHAHGIRRVTVDYNHGWASVPAEIVAALADDAAQTLLTPIEQAQGVSQKSETVGPYQETVTYAAWAIGAGAKLSPSTRALAVSYGVSLPRTLNTGAVL